MAYINPVEASPDNYKLLIEEGNTRLVEMRIKAGENDTTHSHPSELVYFVKGGKARVHMENGETMEAEFTDGGVMAHGAWTHRVENSGDNDIHAIIFETT